MIEYHDDIAEIDGITFRKDKKSGYYLSSKAIQGKRKRLHIYIWEKNNGEIPKKYVIHHKDHNKDNNEISNLELLTDAEHRKRHIVEMTEEERKRKAENLRKNVAPKAAGWHKSKNGKEWHKNHYENMKEKLHVEREFECQYCGKLFIAQVTGLNRFCSNNCKSAYRRKSGVDNVVRKCECCGNEFITNKYSKARYCEKHRGKSSRSGRESGCV